MKFQYLLSLLALFFFCSLQAQDWQVYDADEVPADAGFSNNGGSANSFSSIIADPDNPGNNLLYYISPDPNSQYSFTHQLPSTVNDLTLA
ncbi:MAG: hypothetical protein KDC44_24745, partial [Phaeodactylibacter sp.]|nr:hypothetical protein [Phaeodactylibacter sp.]